MTAEVSMSAERGFSLVELLVVIALIGIGATVATLNFNSFMKKANVEKQAKELFSDLNDARLQSMYLKKRHSIILYPNRYAFKQYSSENEGVAAGRVLFTKNVPNTITKEDGDAFTDTNNVIQFDIRGFTNDSMTIRTNPVASGAALDCIVISTARANMGQMEKSGSTYVCNQK